MAGLMTWALWHHHNAAIFDKIAPSTSVVVAAIKDDARFCAIAGAKDLALLPL